MFSCYLPISYRKVEVGYLTIATILVRALHTEARRSLWSHVLTQSNRKKGPSPCSVLTAQELCESRGGHPGLPVPNSPYSFCGRKATLNLNLSRPTVERRALANQPRAPISCRFWHGVVRAGQLVWAALISAWKLSATAVPVPFCRHRAR